MYRAVKRVRGREFDVSRRQKQKIAQSYGCGYGVSVLFELKFSDVS